MGTSAAFFLAQRDVKVVLLERDTIGSGASGSAAGILTDPMFVDATTSYRDMAPFPRLNRASYRFYPRFFDELSTYSNTQPEYYNHGGYYLAFDEEQLQARRSYYQEMEKFNRPVEWLEAEEIKHEIDAVNPNVLGGFYYQAEGWVVPRQIMAALKEATCSLGGAVEERLEVTSVSETNKAVMVETGNKSFEGERALVAAGAWSRQLLKQDGVKLPIYPRKGEMIELQSPKLKDISLMRHDGSYLVPRGNQTAVVGATMYKEDDFGQEVTRAGRRQLLNQAREMVPGLDKSDIIDSWAGLRPYADRKGGPFVGPLPKQRNVYVCAGHYRNGITQGPFSARLIVDDMLGESPALELGDYRLDRI